MFYYAAISQKPLGYFSCLFDFINHIQICKLAPTFRAETEARESFCFVLRIKFLVTLTRAHRSIKPSELRVSIVLCKGEELHKRRTNLN
jgi:hypothetical protein